MSTNKYALILDTNILYNNFSTKYTDLDLRTFDIFQLFLEHINMTTPYTLKLFISEVTIEELIQQQYEGFNKKIEKLNNLIDDIGKIIGLNNIKFDYLNFLHNRWNELITSNWGMFISVIPYPNRHPSKD